MKHRYHLNVVFQFMLGYYFIEVIRMNEDEDEKIKLAKMAEMVLNQSLLDKKIFDVFFDWLKHATIKDIENVIVENKTHISAKNLRIIKLYAQRKVKIKVSIHSIIIYIVKAFIGSTAFLVSVSLLGSFIGSLNRSIIIKGTLNGLQPHPTYVPHDQPTSFYVDILTIVAVVIIFIWFAIYIKETYFTRVIAFKHARLKYDYLIEILK
ncbi:hypothetical protein [Lacticaseibacillus paracasei]|uniref:hypothetical protein n=1 Tax=Lacticaseibacillus paracasei TaxID=1597 RepID=UPI00131FFE5E|nr:hypothetical protein [Lacticaseibacillus paracasei]QHC81188.1 hypothetical protein F5J09_04880 [Lacticaseibacillus paracasei]